MKSLLILSSLGLFLGLSFPNHATAVPGTQDKILVGIYQNEPKIFRNGNGEPAGFWVDLLEAIAAAEAWQLEYIPCEWEACLKAVEQGELDLMMDVAYSPERDRRFAFNEEVVLASWSVVYADQDQPLNSLLDLDGKRVAVLQGSIQKNMLQARAEMFDVAPELVEVENFSQVFALIADGSVDAGVVNRFFGAQFKHDYGLIPTNILVESSQLHFITAKGGNLEHLHTLDVYIKKLKTDKTSVYYQALTRWLEPEDAKVKLTVQEFLLYLILIVPIAGLLASLAWNQLLRREIRQRQQVEKALRESEARFQNMAANVPGAIFRYVLHPDGSNGVIYMSSGCKDLWEVELATVVDDASILWEMVYGEDLPGLWQSVQDSAQTLEPWSWQWRIMTPSGQLKWLEAAGRPQRYENGDVIWDTLILDVSDRHRVEVQRHAAELALQQSEYRYRQMVQSQTDFLLRSLPDTTITFANESLCQMLGVTLEEILGLQWINFANTDDLSQEQTLKRLSQLTPDQPTFMAVNRDRRRGGEEGWTQWLNQGIFNAQGELIEVQSVGRDITALKQAETALQESEMLFRSLFEQVRVGIIFCDAQGQLLRVNRKYCEITGYSPEELQTMHWLDLTDGKNRQQNSQQLADIMMGISHSFIQEERYIRKDGSQIWVEITGSRIENLQKKSPVQLMVGIVDDISDRKRAEFNLAESEARFRLVSENMSDLVCIHGPEGHYLYVTPSSILMLGYHPNELLGRNFYHFCHPEDQDRVKNAFCRPYPAGKPIPITYRICKKSGHYIWLETFTKCLLDEQGKIRHIQSTSREVSDRIKIEEQLRYDAHHDALTGLPNRSFLMERLGQAELRAKENSDFLFAVLFLDLDQFKVINDSLGHLMGDQLLVAIANQLQLLMEPNHFVSRLGGDEFIILLENLEGIETAINLAEQILSNLRSPLLFGDRDIFISTSIGIALWDRTLLKADDLIRNADIAMYRAKLGGRSRYALFDPAMHLQVINRLQLENDLRKALERGQLLLFYQPIVSLANQKIIGFEALVRWQHPSRGMIPPDQFISMAEETGLIIPIGAWILATACQQLAQWQAQFAYRLKMSVNLSLKQLQESILIQQINEVIATTGIRCEDLTLEITESMLVQNVAGTCALLTQIREKGIQISIDDFGTGYSSLSYLYQLPLDFLKIDRTFVQQMQAGSKNQVIAELIITLSNVLELQAIAEGIETPQQLQWLQALECELGQGYLFSRPVNAQEATALLQAGATISPSHASSG
ncbi:EAL domain-containing protein [Spirulina sp. CCNP1310]|uniref:EAL domain-containing protein n=1 Tax=Spirulina sp. CCNP1310 TaxID=3110249 RepID=UPI002B21D7BF|nr:EAL domain-containing protein [Spirulina sp. CCNP1310]